MMKYKSVIFLITLIFFGSPTFAMEQQNPTVAPSQTPAISTSQPATLKTPWFGIPINVQTNFVSNEDVQKGMKIAEEFNTTARSAISKTEQITDSLKSVGNGVARVGEGISKVGDGFKDIAVSVKEASTNVKLAMDNTANIIDNGVKNLSLNVQDAAKDIVKATDGLSKEMDTFRMRVAPETFVELNKTGVSVIKTCLIGGIGGAIALSGIILFFKTLSEKSNETQEDNRPLYKRILTNRYLISALLMAAGTGIILKSDRIVEAIS